MNDIPQPLTPAFPNNGVTGMSLRDYFAAKALNGFLAEGAMVRMGSAAKDCPDCPDSDKEIKQAIATVLAASAYMIADAMLKAREQ